MASYGDKKPMPKVSEWFTVEEVEHSDTAIRLGISNKASEIVLARARKVGVNVMDPIRENWDIPFRPNSWYRSEPLEKVITWDGGFKNWCAKYKPGVWCEQGLIYKHMKCQDAWDQYFAKKQHPTGGAVDHEIASVDNDALFFWIKKNLDYDQLIREFPKPGVPNSGWVHVSYVSETENRHQHFSVPSYDRYN